MMTSGGTVTDTVRVYLPTAGGVIRALTALPLTLHSPVDSVSPSLKVHVAAVMTTLAVGSAGLTSKS